jgi:hypothetical protein
LGDVQFRRGAAEMQFLGELYDNLENAFIENHLNRVTWRRGARPEGVKCLL